MNSRSKIEIVLKLSLVVLTVAVGIVLGTGWLVEDVKQESPTPGLVEEPVNDQRTWHLLKKGMRKLEDAGEMIDGDLSRAVAAENLVFRSQTEEGELPLRELYVEASRSVLVIATHCRRGDGKDERFAASTCFVVAPEAVATNAHVIKMKGGNLLGLAVMTRDGEVFPVKRVLARDELSDVAILDVPGLTALPLRLEPRSFVGERVAVISHPNGRFYRLSEGIVARRFVEIEKGRHVPRLAITAEFAPGSSGAPVFNSRGAVIGMVRSVTTLEALKKSHAATFRSCVPAEAIMALGSTGKTESGEESVSE